MEKVAMNLCFLMGKINSEIDFNFILNSKNISAVSFELEINKRNKMQIKAYNEIADGCYQNLNKNDMVLVQGQLNTKMEIIITNLKKLG